MRGGCVVCACDGRAEPSRVHTCRTEVGAGGAPGAGGGACVGEAREGFRGQTEPDDQKGGGGREGREPYKHRHTSTLAPRAIRAWSRPGFSVLVSSLIASAGVIGHDLASTQIAQISSAYNIRVLNIISSKWRSTLILFHWYNIL